MQIKKQDCKIWVNCKDEKPDNDAVSFKYVNKQRYWLKPLKEVYPLTEDEIEGVLVEFCNRMFSVTDSLPMIREFIKSITNGK